MEPCFVKSIGLARICDFISANLLEDFWGQFFDFSTRGGRVVIGIFNCFSGDGTRKLSGTLISADLR
jgi:hypothetical protein